MSTKGRNRGKYQPGPVTGPGVGKRVPSLLSAMRDGAEYESIVPLLPESDEALNKDMSRALKDLQDIRGRKCICYLANMIRDVPDTGIGRGDHLPFNEMVAKVDPAAREVDVFLATPGGMAQQVTQFVTALRPRFDEVDFILPYKAMSAGTLWALSGNKIWMTDRAFLGPIDPQVPTKDGRLVPAQSLLALMKWIQEQGEEALNKKVPIPWSLGPLINGIDKKELGDAITATEYCTDLAAQYLEHYKFKNWAQHRSSGGHAVTRQDRHIRAVEVAKLLASNAHWKAHGHAIDRAACKAVRIEIDHPSLEMDKAVKRLWALFHWIFDRGAVARILLSENYTFARLVIAAKQQGGT